jgi:hypothetical protein
MEIIIGIIIIVLIALLAAEYRIKKPGQIILYESHGKVKYRKSRFYPKHLSLIIPNTTYTLSSAVEPEAKGKISLNVKFAFTITPSMDNISSLIKIGGWGKDLLKDAAKELDVILQGKIKEFTENFDIEEIKTESIVSYLRKNLTDVNKQFGFEIISLTILSVEPSDKKIVDAIRQKEASRILEETEKINQQVRIQTAQQKLKADEEILLYEHNLVMKKLHLQEAEEVKDAELRLKKLSEQVKRDKIKLDLEKEEMSIFKNNPELLLLTPQVARLAEASQNLKNAKTVVSLGDIENGSQLVEIMKNFLGGLLNQSTVKK